MTVVAGALLLILLLAGCTPVETDGTTDPSTPSPGIGVDAQATPGAEDGATDPATAPSPTVLPTPTDVAFDLGVTDEACPDATNPDNGCIYLGTVLDLSPDSAGVDSPLHVAARDAFWERVNESGGIGGFDVDVVTRGSGGEGTNGETPVAGVLAMALVGGRDGTRALLPRLRAEGILAVPVAPPPSAWLFEPVLLESGTTDCLQAMNGLDHLVEVQERAVDAVAVIHVAGEVGDDLTAGARRWAFGSGAALATVPIPAGPEIADEVVPRALEGAPDVLLLATTAEEARVLIDRALAQGFGGVVLLTDHVAERLDLDEAAGEALRDRVVVTGPWEHIDADTPGHQALREQLGDIELRAAHIATWASSYALLTVLRQAVADGDLTRAGLRDALARTIEVDYEGILPVGAGNLAGEANGRAERTTAISRMETNEVGGITTIEAFYGGPTARDHDLSTPC